MVVAGRRLDRTAVPARDRAPEETGENVSLEQFNARDACVTIDVPSVPSGSTEDLIRRDEVRRVCYWNARSSCS
jgi:hypothetical protein